MGPITRELWAVAGLRESLWREQIMRLVSNGAYEVARGAAESLGYPNVSTAYLAGAMPDVLSEAIEAAEALSL